MISFFSFSDHLCKWAEPKNVIKLRYWIPSFFYLIPPNEGMIFFLYLYFFTIHFLFNLYPMFLQYR